MTDASELICFERMDLDFSCCADDLSPFQPGCVHTIYVHIKLSSPRFVKLAEYVFEADGEFGEGSGGLSLIHI